MPKLKTNRSVAKRFRLTGKGKVKRPHAYKGHLLGHKSKKRKRLLRRRALVSSVDEKRLKRMLPYG